MSIENLPNDAYHAHPAISKTGLWKLYTSTPAHFRFGERVSKPEWELGQAAHDAILQPELFETTYYRVAGDPARNTVAWKNAAEFAAAHDLTPMKARDYDAALRIRDSAAQIETIASVVRDGIREQAAFWADPTTKIVCRCKPDVYSPSCEIMLDIKTCVSAAPTRIGFQAAVARFGYHVQDAFYTEGWERAGGGKSAGMIFVAIEKQPPYLIALYELSPNAIEEGRTIVRKTLAQYAACWAADHWPGYPADPQILALPNWAFNETAPEEE